MYNDQLVEATIDVDDIFLDPNNPRFWSEQSRRHIPDSRIMDSKIQARIEEEIYSHDIEDLHYSILRNGFLPLDRIVVRAIDGADRKFVAVEGNRRLAAIRLLRERIEEGTVAEEDIGLDYLEEIVAQTDELNVLVYEGNDSEDVSWVLQGIRHISGIRNWEPAQRAKLVADQIDEQGAGFSETGQKFGLSARAVGRLYRSYKALEQMRDDDEFGKVAKNEYFSLFEEGYRNRTVRDWLAWNEESMQFDDVDNLRTFYAWITHDEEHPERKRRIHDTKHVKSLAMLIAGDHSMLMSRVDQHDMGIEAAETEAKDVSLSETWRDTIGRSLVLIQSLSIEVISENPRECREMLREVVQQIRKFIKMADALLE